MCALLLFQAHSKEKEAVHKQQLQIETSGGQKDFCISIIAGICKSPFEKPS